MRKNLLLAIISDIHGHLTIGLTKGDVLCICGDIFPKDIDRDLSKSHIWFTTVFLPWIQNIKYSKILLLPGNHDMYLQEIGDNIHSIIKEFNLSSKLIFLCNRSFVYGNWTFYGSPWVTNLPRWAFNTDDPQGKFEQIPHDCDVLLTHHAPDYGKLGCSYPNTDKEIEFGCPELTNAIKNRPNIKYHFCGHIHTGTHGGVEKGSTKSYNVSILDENYKVAFPITYIELKTN